MAEIIENTNGNHNYASNGKANAALTLGIIGTALSALELGGAFSLDFLVEDLTQAGQPASPMRNST